MTGVTGQFRQSPDLILRDAAEDGCGRHVCHGTIVGLLALHGAEDIGLCLRLEGILTLLQECDSVVSCGLVIPIVRLFWVWDWFLQRDTGHGVERRQFWLLQSEDRDHTRRVATAPCRE